MKYNTLNNGIYVRFVFVVLFTFLPFLVSAGDDIVFIVNQGRDIIFDETVLVDWRFPGEYDECTINIFAEPDRELVISYVLDKYADYPDGSREFQIDLGTTYTFAYTCMADGQIVTRAVETHILSVVDEIPLDPFTKEPEWLQVIQFDSEHADSCHISVRNLTTDIANTVNKDIDTSGTVQIPKEYYSDPAQYEIELTCSNAGNENSDTREFIVTDSSPAHMDMRIVLSYGSTVDRQMLQTQSAEGCTEIGAEGCVCRDDVCNYTYQAPLGEAGAQEGRVIVTTDNPSHERCQITSTDGLATGVIQPSYDITHWSPTSYITADKAVSATCWQVVNGEPVNHQTIQVNFSFQLATDGDGDEIDPETVREPEVNISLRRTDSGEELKLNNWSSQPSTNESFRIERTNTTSCDSNYTIEGNGRSFSVSNRNTSWSQWNNITEAGEYTVSMTCYRDIIGAGVLSTTTTRTFEVLPADPLEEILTTLELVGTVSENNETTAKICWTSGMEYPADRTCADFVNEYDIWVDSGNSQSSFDPSFRPSPRPDARAEYCRFTVESDRSVLSPTQLGLHSSSNNRASGGYDGTDPHFPVWRSVTFSNTGDTINISLVCYRDIDSSESIKRTISFELPEPEGGDTDSDVLSEPGLEVDVVSAEPPHLSISEIQLDRLYDMNTYPNGAVDIMVDYRSSNSTFCNMREEVAPDGTVTNFGNSNQTIDQVRRTLSQVGTYTYRVQCGRQLAGFSEPILTSIVSATVDVLPADPLPDPTVIMNFVQLSSQSQTESSFGISWESQFTRECFFDGETSDGLSIPMQSLSGSQSVSGYRTLTFSNIGETYTIRINCTRDPIDDKVASTSVEITTMESPVFTQIPTSFVRIVDSSDQEIAQSIQIDSLLGNVTAFIEFGSTNADRCFVMNEYRNGDFIRKFINTPALSSGRIVRVYTEPGLYSYEVQCGREMFGGTDGFFLSDVATTSVNVLASEPIDDPTVELNASLYQDDTPIHITESINRVTLNWRSENTTHCSFSAVDDNGNSVNLNPLPGSDSLSATSGEALVPFDNDGREITITATCSRPAGNASDSEERTIRLPMSTNFLPEGDTTPIISEGEDEIQRPSGDCLTQSLNLVLIGSSEMPLYQFGYYRELEDDGNYYCRRNLPDISPEDAVFTTNYDWQLDWSDEENLLFSDIDFTVYFENTSNDGYLFAGESAEYYISIAYENDPGNFVTILEIDDVQTLEGPLLPRPDGSARAITNRLNSIPLGEHVIRVWVDRHAGIEGESEFVSADFMFTVELPEPEISLEASPRIVRSGDSVEVSWTVQNIGYPLQCRLFGLGDKNWFDVIDNEGIETDLRQDAISIELFNAGSVNMECRERVTGFDRIVSSVSESVEVIPPVIER